MGNHREPKINDNGYDVVYGDDGQISGCCIFFVVVVVVVVVNN